MRWTATRPRGVLAGLALTAAMAAMAHAAAACAPSASLTAIADVQGSGPRSPLVGRRVSVQGVVTATFSGPDALGGFFLQDPLGDGDPATSDAVFIEERPGLAPPRPGDVLRVVGRVGEARDITRIVAAGPPARCGTAPLPAARPLQLPLPPVPGWEALEGMLVRVPEPLTITGVADLGRYGELTLARGRLFAPTQGVPDSGPATLGRIVLDDGSWLPDPRPPPYRLPDGRPPRVGDVVGGLLAVVVQYAPGAYALEPVGRPRPHIANPRPGTPPAVGGAIRVASFNVHNFFVTLHGRGARTRSEYLQQRDKLVAAIIGLDADAVLLQEVEADGMTADDALVSAVNARLGGPVYAAVPDPAGGVGGDLIKQAILYRSATLRLISSASDPAPVFERAPVAATFRLPQGGVLSVVNVHLKAKSGCPAAGDVDRGYGCWNLRRSAQAQAALAFAAALARRSGSPDVLVAGDFNSYAAEPPVALFRRDGYLDAAAGLPPAARYSYVYAGASGTLDYAFLSPSLAGRLTGAGYWHIDADESSLLAAGGGLAPAGANVAATPFRASDHDPLLLGLDTTAGGR